jgi:hypothetical protein
MKRTVTNLQGERGAKRINKQITLVIDGFNELRAFSTSPKPVKMLDALLRLIGDLFKRQFQGI